MLKENEVVMLVLGIGVLFIILLNRANLNRIRFWKFLCSGYCVLLFGWILTVLEGFFLAQLLNLFEHISYTISASLLLFWAWKTTGRVTKEDI